MEDWKYDACYSQKDFDKREIPLKFDSLQRALRGMLGYSDLEIDAVNAIDCSSDSIRLSVITSQETEGGYERLYFELRISLDDGTIEYCIETYDE